jgi:hypothetical protein
MLDYAANGMQFWSIKDIREAYERNTLDGASTSLSDIGIEDEDLYWQNVDMNLRNGKVRLLFIADIIPTSLQAIIEFLNKQMRDTEVYGLEIKQFVGKNGLKTLVPNLIGRTASAVQAKCGESKQKYNDRNDFFDSVKNTHISDLYANLFAFADKNNYRIVMGTAGFSLSVASTSGKSYTLLYGYGADAINKKNCIVTTFGLLKEKNNNVLEHYRGMVSNLNFFEQTPIGNFKWQLSGASTDEEMQRLMILIKDVASLIIE